MYLTRSTTTPEKVNEEEWTRELSCLVYSQTVHFTEYLYHMLVSDQQHKKFLLFFATNKDTIIINK
jgi:hypothetical protein